MLRSLPAQYGGLEFTRVTTVDLHVFWKEAWIVAATACDLLLCEGGGTCNEADRVCE